MSGRSASRAVPHRDLGADPAAVARRSARPAEGAAAAALGVPAGRRRGRRRSPPVGVSLLPTLLGLPAPLAARCCGRSPAMLVTGGAARGRARRHRRRVWRRRARATKSSRSCATAATARYGILALIVSIGLRARGARPRSATRSQAGAGADRRACRLARRAAAGDAPAAAGARRTGSAPTAGRPSARRRAGRRRDRRAPSRSACWDRGSGRRSPSGRSAVAVAGTAMLAQRQIGGYTGDVLGAFQQVGEIVMLLVAAAR